MGCTVAELQERMDAREFAEWMAFAQFGPISPEALAERADLRSGDVAAMLFNTNRSKSQRALKATDFVRKRVARRRGRMSPDEIRAALAPLKALTGK